MNHMPVDSKLLKSIAYEDGVLEVVFNKGTAYRYAGVTPEQFDAMKSADSVGGHFLREIKPKLTGERIEDTP
jgi:hypothetical protein